MGNGGGDDDDGGGDGDDNDEIITNDGDENQLRYLGRLERQTATKGYICYENSKQENRLTRILRSRQVEHPLLGLPQ